VNQSGCCIYLIRHGQTTLNVDERFRGRLDVPLNDQGREDARCQGRDLADVGLSAVYAAPLSRTRETARLIAAQLPYPAGVFDHPLLLNLNYGKWEGLSKEEASDRDPEEWQRYQQTPFQAVCPEGESLMMATKRIMDALVAIALVHPGERVAAVTHGIMVRLAIAAVLRPDDFWGFKVQTGQGTRFDVAGDEIVVRLDAPLSPKDHAEAQLFGAG
jgi:broad specificity phosphatase PhoE